MFDASLGSFRVTLVCASCGLLVLLVLVVGGALWFAACFCFRF